MQVRCIALHFFYGNGNIILEVKYFHRANLLNIIVFLPVCTSVYKIVLSKNKFMEKVNAQKPATASINWYEKHGAAVSTLICLLLIIIGWYAGNGNKWLSISLFIAAFIAGGHQKAIEGLITLFKEKDLDVDLLMVIAAIGAAAIGYWMDGALLIFIFSLSGVLEGYTMAKTNKDLSSVMELRPESATLLQDGQEKLVSIDSLKPEDIVVIRPGERIPVDGQIINGSTAVNQAAITGESLAVDKVMGDPIFAGTINGQGAVQVKVTKLHEDTVLAKIIHLVQEAQTEKPPVQQFIERFEGVYSKVVLAAAALLMFLPHYILGWTWSDTIYKAMVFLVVASPCALVSSTMPAILSAISNASRNKVLFKGGAHLENIASVKVVAFDKTGTLTFGKPEVTDINSFDGVEQNELLTIAASIEMLSEHPIAKSIMVKAAEQNIVLHRPEQFQAKPGIGIEAVLKGKIYKAGKSNIIDNSSLDKSKKDMIQNLEAQGKTVIYIAENNALIGILALRDKVRPRSPRVITDLKEMGIRTVMLTGDSTIAAEAIASETQIDEIYSNLMPEDKTRIIEELSAKYGKVSMVGDGINDAPALAAASVGIAMGDGGTDIAIETADVILMSDAVESIPFAIKLGKRTNKIIKQNIVFAIGVALSLITVNFIGGINLPEGVIGHEGSTVLVILSGLRLLTIPIPK
ncbi:heavy metal translocating P-type ATPase [Flavobacterium sp. FlaQc-30]|uniref:heavy metal translocating P-type ATPase n=1 Tax=Flavobacterium sp. FlaQc-30 TaxID=3374179 RepID=UPI0037569398